MASASSAPVRKLRIATLHGYTSNAFIFTKRLGAIRKACKDVADFIPLNGPHLVQPITSPSGSLDAPEQSEEVNENTPIEEQPRAWWKAKDDGTYDGLQLTVEFLNQKLKEEGSFDGVFGFSQGACFAGMLASALEGPKSPNRIKGLIVPENQGPLKFCVAIGGFRARDPSFQDDLFPKSGIQTPVLHVLGKNDFVVDAERSQTLIDACANSRVEQHEGGHATPSQAAWRNFFRDYITSFLPDQTEQPNWRDVVGPNERPKGPDNSGTSTPIEHEPQSRQEGKGNL